MAKSELAKKYDKADKKIHRISSTIGAVIAIVGALTGALGWVQTQFTAAVTAQVEDLKEEMQASNKNQDLAIMRLELMSLIENDPDNTVEIERLGKKYFQAGGDTWMSGYYSKYAREHGLDTSFIVK